MRLREDARRHLDAVGTDPQRDARRAALAAERHAADLVALAERELPLAVLAGRIGGEGAERPIERGGEQRTARDRTHRVRSAAPVADAPARGQQTRAAAMAVRLPHG